MDTRGVTTVIKAQVPMSEMLTHEQHLTSCHRRPRQLPHGALALRRGAVPLQTKIIAASKAERGQAVTEEE
jgi:hypothetical protein